MVDCTGLENRQRATVREFESHRFRQIKKECGLRAAFFLVFRETRRSVQARGWDGHDPAMNLAPCAINMEAVIHLSMRT